MLRNFLNISQKTNEKYIISFCASFGGNSKKQRVYKKPSIEIFVSKE